MRVHIHDEIGVGQALELAINLVARRARVAHLLDGRSLHIGVGQRPAQALARIEQLPRGLAAARAAAALPPGIAADRRAPANAGEIRAEFRREFQLADDNLLLVQIGSGFKTKGLDRSLKALAALPRALKQRTRLIAIGQDDPKPFLLQVKALGLSGQVQILKGRSDIPRVLLGADLLIHPAYNENTGTVLLEALVAGLPVLVTDVCGYAHYITDANCGRVVPSPFEQQVLDQMLAQMLADAAQRSAWSRNALAFAETADLYSMPQKAADVILGESA